MPSVGCNRDQSRRGVAQSRWMCAFKAAIATFWRVKASSRSPWRRFARCFHDRDLREMDASLESHPATPSEERSLESASALIQLEAWSASPQEFLCSWKPTKSSHLLASRSTTRLLPLLLALYSFPLQVCSPQSHLACSFRCDNRFRRSRHL